MVPRVGKTGSSFKGAGLYFLHDKDAQTADRVAFTQTHNIPTDDPERAFDWMAWTAMHQSELKEAAGVKATGGNCERPVFHYSLAWHPDEYPDESHMLACARETLSLLGLAKHEAVFVAHNDEEHPHIHIIANLVSPITGRTNEPYRSGQKLSGWAERYELEHGIHCEQRMTNNALRRQGQQVNYKVPVMDDKEQLQALYSQCDSFGAFRGALENAGYQVAAGDRRGVVIMDGEGKVHSLTRQLTKEQRVQLKEQLKAVDLSALQDAGEMQAQYRQAKAEQQREHRQAAQPEQETQTESEGRQQGGGAETLKPSQEPPQAAPEPEDHEDPPQHVFDLNALRSRQFEELSAFSSWHYEERGKLAEQLARQFDAPLRQQKERAAELEFRLSRDIGIRGWWRGLTGQAKQDAAELDQVRNQVETMQSQVRQSQAAYEARRQAEFAEVQQRHERERQAVHVPEPQTQHQSETRPSHQQREGPTRSL